MLVAFYDGQENVIKVICIPICGVDFAECDILLIIVRDRINSKIIRIQSTYGMTLYVNK